MNTESGAGLKSEINVTPMVDVVLVLLIIFMVVTPMMVSQGIQLPNGKHVGPVREQDRAKTIALTETGLLFYEQEPVSEEALQEHLRELFRTNPATQVVLRADRRVVYGDVHRILDIASGAGFHNLALLADPTPRK